MPILETWMVLTSYCCTIDSNLHSQYCYRVQTNHGISSLRHSVVLLLYRSLYILLLLLNCNNHPEGNSGSDVPVLEKSSCFVHTRLVYHLSLVLKEMYYSEFNIKDWLSTVEQILVIRAKKFYDADGNSCWHVSSLRAQNGVPCPVFSNDGLCQFHLYAGSFQISFSVRAYAEKKWE